MQYIQDMYRAKVSYIQITKRLQQAKFIETKKMIPFKVSFLNINFRNEMPLGFKSFRND